MKTVTLTLALLTAASAFSALSLRCLNAYVDARVREQEVRSSFELLRSQHEALTRTISGAADPAFVCFNKAGR